MSVSIHEQAIQAHHCRLAWLLSPVAMLALDDTDRRRKVRKNIRAVRKHQAKLKAA
jgi:hypothetical protein